MNTNISNHLFHVLSAAILIVFALICTYPFYYILIYSLSDSIEGARGLTLYPRGFTFSNYQRIFTKGNIYNAFIISTLRTIIGTAISLFFSSMFAYIVMKKELKFRKTIYRLTIASMYFNAGLIPWYITMLHYGLKNNFLLYVIPGAVAPFFIILIKTYFEQIPAALEESAIMDGAGYFTIYSKLMLPLALPVLAAVAVFGAVGQWNSWTDNFYLVSTPSLQTLQLLLLNILNESEALAKAVNVNKSLNVSQNMQISPMAIRMTITMISVLPVLFVYPLMQKYFVKGIMLGAIKG